MPQWPTQWQGLGYSTREAVAVRQTLAAEGVPGPPAGLGMMMAAPTIFAHGTDAQKRR
jgi:alkylation response protein AidB-like acyl-CoA dehydrogenase